MNHPDVTETIFQALHALGHKPGSVTTSTHLEEDLGIDSREVVEISVTGCQQLGLPPHVSPDVRNVKTVEDLAGRIQQLLATSEHAVGKEVS